MRRRRTAARSTAALLGLALVAAVLAAGTLSVTTVTPAQAAAGNPGVPSAPTVVYAEDFQNRPGPAPIVRLSDYVGTTGQTYTADPVWLSDCNGWIASANQSVTSAAQIADCNVSQSSWNRSQQLAQAIGLFNGQSVPAAADNYSDTAYTSGDPGVGAVEFETAANIPFVATDRFVTFAVDVAAVNCTVSAPLLAFSLLDAAGAATPVGPQVDACAGSSIFNVPALGVATPTEASVGRTIADGSILFSGSSIGVRMTNGNGSGAGNDHAIDNIEILDVTPQLDKSFAPASAVAGEASTLTFTVTNTDELAAKNGWSFTDDLPAGLVITDPTAATTTCTAGVVTAAVGGTTIGVKGNLDKAQDSCTASVKVTSETPGSYTNGPGNITSAGLNPPAPATVTFTTPPDAYTVTKSSDHATPKPGDTVTYSVAVKNTGTVAYVAASPASFTDDLSKVLDDATYNGDASAGATVTAGKLTWAGELALGQTRTVTYSVKVNDPVTGDGILANVVVPTGKGGTCATAATCAVASRIVSVPTVTTVASKQKVTVGQKVHDTVTIGGLSSPTTVSGNLYGPFSTQKKIRCVASKSIGTVSFAAAGNGTYRTDRIKITSPGWYSWSMTVAATDRSLAATEGCGVASETVRATRAAVPVLPQVPTGYSGQVSQSTGSFGILSRLATSYGVRTGHVKAGKPGSLPVLGSAAAASMRQQVGPRVRPVAAAAARHTARLFSPADGQGVSRNGRTTISWGSRPATRTSAVVDDVRVVKNQVAVPGAVERVGMLRSSARLDDVIGSTVIAGHVSDRRDSPGAFSGLTSVKKGDVVTVTRGGKDYRFRITKLRTYERTAQLPVNAFSTVGEHRLTLITCTDRVVAPGGGFHYAKNLVVTATQIG